MRRTVQDVTVRIFIILTMSFLCVSLTGFSRAALSKPAVQTADYSPFILRIDGHPAFDTISFKNVSTTSRANESDFELMAESLALALRSSHPEVSIEVIYSSRFLRPENHLFCADRHLYIDFWGIAEKDGGYSLWAGCGLSDRFEWRQLSLDDPKLIQRLERVTTDVSQRLKLADKRACYGRSC
jgi:hypothetical protein